MKPTFYKNMIIIESKSTACRFLGSNKINFFKMKKRLIFIIFLCLGIVPTEIIAQDANSFYFMRGVPQTYQVNPALQPEFNFFIGLPGLAPFKFNLKTPIGVSDAFRYDANTDSTYFSEQGFLDGLTDFNNITTEFSTSLASVGWRNDKSYITLDIRQKGFIDLGFSKDFARMPFDGFGEGEVYDLDMDMTMNFYSEWSMGISRKIGDKLTVGWRGKLLFGQANLHTPKFNIGIESGVDQWQVDSDIQVRASAPYLLDYITFASRVPFDVAFGDFENFDVDSPSPKEIQEMALNFSNFGLAMDIGADLRLFDWLQLSASIVDLGSIKWDNMANIEHNVNYTFNGIDVGDLEDDFADIFLDSLEATFDQVSTVKDKYRASIPTKVYIGGAVYPHPRVSFGVLSRTDIYNSKLRQQFTLSANLYPINVISTTISYSLLQGKYSSYGFGLALKALPFNLYILADIGPSLELYQVPVSDTENLPVGLPLDFRNVNFKIGMNIMLGGPKRNKKLRSPEYDLPLVD